MKSKPFSVSVEVVPPAGPDAGPILAALKSLSKLPVDSYSVATNPVAQPRMSAMALSALIQQKTGRPATLHCTTRDHNRLSLQGLLWGARALGIETILAATGDFVALGNRVTTTTVRDVDIFGLVELGREAGLRTGVVLDPRPESNGLWQAVRWLERKVEAGAQFAVTQPFYDTETAELVVKATKHIDISIIMSVLPLRTLRHAQFLHQRVSGIAVPEAVQERMEKAGDPTAEGTANAREMLAVARDQFSGAYIMPPFDHYDMVIDILPKKK